MGRTARVERATSETKLVVEVDLDGTGRADVVTGVGFFDHMLVALAKHSGIDLSVHAEGDLHIDAHHTVEDVALALGQAFGQALGEKVGITRYGDALVPMDEVLVQAAVDLSGRPYCVHVEPENMTSMIGPDYPTSLTAHVLQSFAFAARITLHIRVLHAGRDAHHIVEGQFKALARALRMAVALDPRIGGVPSTKGRL
ncbi:MAG: imidazoleglycerol-phosphate dehydratase HisB [Actinomycetota bacterium]|jgi:imidazoleglycerol-phosphate dehydratase|nr:imidazoleglycerol-phosphate dehydratase HisB [Geodermatophilaceae bacterium]MDQ3054925.1 imidazoleglycerol-phosphate dehydratase HisB [Actinomycetota bacterium]